MGDFIYVDNSNLYIEGRRVSAVQRKMVGSMTEAMDKGVLDLSYSISFGKLYEFLTGGDLSKIKRAALYGSRPPPNDSIWVHAKRAGFELHLEDRNAQNKEKKIDTGLVTLMLKDAYKNGHAGSDTFVLVTGDADFVPTIQAIKEEGYRVEVVFWSLANREMKAAADKFICLDDHLETLRLLS